MNTSNSSRRKFLKQSSLAGLGTVLGVQAAPSLFASVKSSASVPAILGGTPIRAGKTWPKWPIWIPETDGKRVNEVLSSGVWSRAEVVREFETKFAQTVGAKRCLTVVNGTNALTVAMNQLNIGGGDEVIVPPYTFIGTVQAILTNGAMPVFVDTDRETFQIDPSKIEAKITSRTKAILPVHLLGLPADMTRIMAIAKKHNLFVIEDACQSHLAEINNKQVGTFGDAGCFSFQNSKNLPIGEGGAIVSDNEAFIDKCYSYHNYGLPYGTAIGKINTGAIIQGTKLRLTEYQAAIGLAQLARLDAQTTARSKNAEYLKSKIEHIPGITPYKLNEGVTRVAFHVFPFRYNKEEFKGLSKQAFIKALVAEGIPGLAGYTPLNTQPYLNDAFQSARFKRSFPKKVLDIKRYNEQNHCPENEILCNEEAVWFMHSLLLGSRSDMDDIASAIESIHKNADSIKKAAK